MNIRNIPIFIFSTFLVLSGCSSSNTLLTVKKQSDTPESIHKLLVLAMTPNDENRETGEKEIVYWLRDTGYDAFPGCDILSVKGRLPVKEEISKVLTDYGFDGILTMRLVEVDEASQYVSPNSNANIYFYNYLSVWSGYYAPGYIDKTRLLTIESNLYVFPKAEIVYSAISESFISDSFESFAADFSKPLVKSLKKSKILSVKE